jgi:hypothetical protein
MNTARNLRTTADVGIFKLIVIQIEFRTADINGWIMKVVWKVIPRKGNVVEINRLFAIMSATDDVLF